MSLAALAACKFDPPPLVLGGADAAPRIRELDAGLAADAIDVDPAMDVGAGGPDAGFAADAAPASRDAEAMDAPPAGRDAAPVNGDAGWDGGTPVDGGVDPADSGLAPDAGDPDTGLADTGLAIDAGVVPDAGPQPDGGCLPLPLTPGDPMLARQLTVGHTIDRDVLIADLDGDGHDEIAVASSAEGKLTVIDFESCADPTLTTHSNVAIGTDGLVRLDPAQPRIIAAGSGSITALRYLSGAAPAVQQVGSTLPWRGASYLAGHPTRPFLVVAGEDSSGDPAYLYIDGLQGSQSDVQLTEELIGPPAFFDDGGGSSTPRFAATDDQSPMLLFPSSSPAFFGDGRDAHPTTAPVVARAPLFGSGRHVVVYGAENRGTPQLRTARADTADPSRFDTWAGTLSDALVNAPILLRMDTVGGESVRAYFILAGGVISGCELSLRARGEVACDLALIAPVTINAGELSARISLVTAYVDNDAQPDVIVAAAASGSVFFRQPALIFGAAQPVRLGVPIAATPAVSTRFFDRFGAGGTLLAVPHPDGRVSLITWPRTAGQGPADRLWAQYRRDASRSGALE